MTSPGALEAATVALQGAREMAEVAWDDLSGSDALVAAATLARVKALVDGALVGLAEQLEATGAPDAIGWASTKDFLTQLTGGHKGAGGTLTRVAKKTAQLPAVRSALSAARSHFPRPG